MLVQMEDTMEIKNKKRKKKTYEDEDLVGVVGAAVRCLLFERCKFEGVVVCPSGASSSSLSKARDGQFVKVKLDRPLFFELEVELDVDEDAPPLEDVKIEDVEEEEDDDDDEVVAAAEGTCGAKIRVASGYSSAAGWYGPSLLKNVNFSNGNSASWL